MKSRKYLYRCEHCGYHKQRKSNFFTKTFWCVKILGRSLFLLIFLLGIIVIVNFISTGIYDNPDNFISFGGVYAATENMRSYFQSDNKFEEIALNLTKDCKNNYCKSEKIYQHLLTFKYEEGEELNPMIIWNEKECDCDECSFLYKILLGNVGIKSSLQCSNNHCWVIVKLNDKRIKADITKHTWEELE